MHEINKMYVRPRPNFRVFGDESSGSIHYPPQFLCCALRCTSQQAVGSSQHDW